MSKKLCFLDVETTGLIPNKHGVIQIAGCFEIGPTVEYFNYRVAPFEGDGFEQGALDMHKMTMDECFALPAPRKVYDEFTAKLKTFVSPFDRLDKFHFIGYNARFDNDFMRAFFRKAGDKYFGSYFWHPPIDVMGMAALHCVDCRHEFQDFKLGTVAKYFGVEVKEEQLHGADYDIAVTRELFYKIQGEKK